MNETAKHTPGPWEAFAAPKEPHYQGSVYSMLDGKTLAVTYDDEGGANARLMAEAPSMKDALIRIENMADDARGTEFDPVSRTAEEQANLFRMGLVAIAKEAAEALRDLR